MAPANRIQARSSSLAVVLDINLRGLPCTPTHSLRFSSRYSFSAGALLCNASLALWSKVRLPLPAATRRGSSTCRVLLSSAKHRILNSFHFAGSWANHCRRVSLGGTPLSQASRCGDPFFKPRGQNFSTRKRAPVARLWGFIHSFHPDHFSSPSGGHS